ncbi:MAG TPA: F0F1 ATP synthase subunit A [Flavobacteriales bacterium]|nr:F0F1 ATP synthase subunit A [Flavobacteriales bacterium]
MNRVFNRLFFSLIFLLLTPLAVLSQEHENEDHHEGHAKEKGTGEMILEHVTDAHCLHFFETETFHATVPLPCIVYGPNGIDFFMSSNLYGHHGEPVPYTAGSGTTYVLDKEVMKYVNEKGELVTALDLSITKTVLGLFIGIGLMLLIFTKIARRYKTNPLSSPKGTQSFFEPLIMFIRDDVAKPAIGPRHEAFMPFLLTVFFFILICNVLGLIPFIGGFNITGNIAVTLVLATLVFIITSAKATGHYWMHIINPPGIPLWLLPIMIPVEIVGVISKPFVLMLRLFANVTAGHIIILAFTSLIFIFYGKFGVGGAVGASVVSVAFSIFMNLLELLVAFLQAYVFTLLAALYFGGAIEEAHHGHEEAHH